MSDITKIKVDGELESTYKIFSKNREFEKRAECNPDWNQNDDTQPDYVKNRPFYMLDHVETVLMEEITVSFSKSSGLYGAEFPSTFEATVGETYKVYWDGSVYECVCVDFNGILTIGNLSIIGTGSDTGEPFFMNIHNGEGILIGTSDTSDAHTFSISGFISVIKKIDRKYLPKAAFITYDSNNNTYSSDLTNDELYERLLYGEQVVFYRTDQNLYNYLMSWVEGLEGRINLTFAGDYRLSLVPDGTISVTELT